MPLCGSDPVVIVKSRPEWPREFERLAAALAAAAGDGVIEHIGSTAVPGLAAKPIIDLVIVTKTPEEAGRLPG